jgi:hypothetical protein
MQVYVCHKYMPDGSRPVVKVCGSLAKAQATFPVVKTWAALNNTGHVAWEAVREDRPIGAIVVWDIE